MKAIELEQPEIIILVGLPGSGKSTWIRQQMDRHPDKEYVVISSDDIIEGFAAAEGKTYNDVFDKYIGQATAIMKEQARQAIQDRRNIIWDQTNVSPKKRRGILNQARGYRAEAVVWHLSDEEWARRFNKRKTEVGKDIPANVIKSMQDQFTMPTKSEGFEKITVIRA